MCIMMDYRFHAGKHEKFNLTVEEFLSLVTRCLNFMIDIKAYRG